MLDDRPAADEWIAIGTIVSPQGLHGLVRVHPTSDFPERFLEPGTRWLRRGGKGEPETIELLGGREVPGKKLYVVELEGVETRDRAEELRGSVLMVPDSDRPELDEDEYHVRDIIGLAVFDLQTGDRLGTVVDVLTAGHDLLQVKLDPAVATSSPAESPPEPPPKRPKKKPKAPTSDLVLIPFVRAIVPEIDLEAGRLEVALPPGLLDLR
ncbi:MAG: ribosome maturation factor RimM [Cyanobacteria bacterium J055]|nr:MAG: ribosome maturation factor RimM [Cyanobacteria bacterium J055]